MLSRSVASDRRLQYVDVILRTNHQKPRRQSSLRARVARKTQKKSSSAVLHSLCSATGARKLPARRASGATELACRAPIGSVWEQPSPGFEIGNLNQDRVGRHQMGKTDRNARRCPSRHIFQFIPIPAESAHHVRAREPVSKIVLKAAATGIEGRVDRPIGIACDDETDDMTTAVPITKRSCGSRRQFPDR
jgi:hypothetical protein